MRSAILQFHEQFKFKPEVINGETMPRKAGFVVGGMGGSGLAADLLRIVEPGLDLHVHKNYGVPMYSGEAMTEHLFIASSYSGNTEEVLDFAQEAHAHKYALAALTTGGSLLSFAQKHKLPHVVLPDTGIQPRSALGFSLVGLTALMGLEKLGRELSLLSDILKPARYENAGKKMAQTLDGRIPVIYASERNRPLAYIWKIICNETGKIPAYYNTFPELNHNEIEGVENTHMDALHFIFLTDTADHPHIQKRMQVTQQLYEKRGLATTIVPCEGKTLLDALFASILLAQWTALHIAEDAGIDPETVSNVEDLKKML